MGKEILEKATKGVESFPPLSDISKDIYKICNEINPDISSLAKIIKKDPGLTVDVLRMANSPLYGFSREIVDINQVVALFGTSSIKGFLILSVIGQKQVVDFSPYGIDTDIFLNTSRSYSLLAQRMQGEFNINNSTLVSSAFLMIVGMLLLSNTIKDDPIAMKLKELINKGEDLLNIEKELLGVTSLEVSIKLFKHWNFDPEMINMLEGILNLNDKFSKESLILLLTLTLIGLKDSYVDKQLHRANIILLQHKITLDLNKFIKK